MTPEVASYSLALLDTLHDPGRPLDSRLNEFLRIFHASRIKRTGSVRNRIHAFHSLVKPSILRTSSTLSIWTAGESMVGERGRASQTWVISSTIT